MRANWINKARWSTDRANKDVKPWASVKWANFFAGTIETWGTKNQRRRIHLHFPTSALTELFKLIFQHLKEIDDHFATLRLRYQHQIVVGRVQRQTQGDFRRPVVLFHYGVKYLMQGVNILIGNLRRWGARRDRPNQQVRLRGRNSIISTPEGVAVLWMPSLWSRTGKLRCWILESVRWEIRPDREAGGIPCADACCCPAVWEAFAHAKKITFRVIKPLLQLTNLLLLEPIDSPWQHMPVH